MSKIITHSRVLVTGGAGFIGSNLVEALLAQDNNVVCLDNFSTGKRENIAPFLDQPCFQLQEGDIRDREVCRRAVDGADYVLHQAALGSVPRSINDPMTSTEVNITGFVNMLFAAKEAKVKRFVYASSSSVYGDNATLPKVEDQLGRQLSPYAITKYVNELFAANFTSLYGIDTIGLRYFNVFGRRQDPFGAYAAVIPKFAIALLRHEAPCINGDGTYSRDFTYIANVVRANQLAALADNPAALNTAYNVACGDRMDLNRLFASLRAGLAAFDPAIAAIEPTYGPVRAGDVPHSLADISKARKLLGYEPAVNIHDGLQEAAHWYYDHLKKA
jgi:UDP-N-acetylglucosamine 4-epimerase